MGNAFIIGGWCNACGRKRCRWAALVGDRGDGGTGGPATYQDDDLFISKFIASAKHTAERVNAAWSKRTPKTVNRQRTHGVSRNNLT